MTINKRIWKPVLEVAAILGAAAALFATDAAAQQNLCTGPEVAWTQWSRCDDGQGHVADSYGDFITSGPRANVVMWSGSHSGILAGTSVWDAFGNPLRRVQTPGAPTHGVTYSDTLNMAGAATHYSMICPASPGC
jgi:hypothetical protein